MFKSRNYHYTYPDKCTFSTYLKVKNVKKHSFDMPSTSEIPNLPINIHILQLI